MLVLAPPRPSEMPVGEETAMSPGIPRSGRGLHQRARNVALGPAPHGRGMGGAAGPAGRGRAGEGMRTVRGPMLDGPRAPCRTERRRCRRPAACCVSLCLCLVM